LFVLGALFLVHVKAISREGRREKVGGRRLTVGGKKKVGSRQLAVRRKLAVAGKKKVGGWRSSVDSWRSSVFGRQLTAYSLLPTDYKFVLGLCSLRSFAAI